MAKTSHYQAAIDLFTEAIRLLPKEYRSETHNIHGTS